MTTFDNREQAYENKYARDKEMEFKLNARANRLFGTLVGIRLGLSGDALEAYVRAVIESDLEEAGDKDVIRKVAADLAAAGLPADSATLTAERRQCVHEAAVQLGLTES